MTFELIRLRFHFRAAGSLYFPLGKAGNTLRGAFGMLLRETTSRGEYASIFAPKAATGPSGLADPPRPFVIRATHLDGRTIAPGSGFHFDVHLFDLTADRRPLFFAAFARLATEGLGPDAPAPNSSPSIGRTSRSISAANPNTPPISECNS